MKSIIQNKYTTSKTQSPFSKVRTTRSPCHFSVSSASHLALNQVHLWCTATVLTKAGCTPCRINVYYVPPVELMYTICSGEKEIEKFFLEWFKSTSNNFLNTEACNKKGQTHRCPSCLWFQWVPQYPKTLWGQISTST